MHKQFLGLCNVPASILDILREFSFKLASELKQISVLSPMERDSLVLFEDPSYFETFYHSSKCSVDKLFLLIAQLSR